MAKPNKLAMFEWFELNLIPFNTYIELLKGFLFNANGFWNEDWIEEKLCLVIDVSLTIL